MAADTTLAASDPGVDQAQFSVFLARNVERDLVRLENRRDLRCFLQGGWSHNLSRARRERPCDRRAAEKRYELAPPCMSGKEHCEG